MNFKIYPRFRDLIRRKSKNHIDETAPMLPEGWTYLRHGTGTGCWPLKENITIGIDAVTGEPIRYTIADDPGLAVVWREEALEMINLKDDDGGNVNKALGYSRHKPGIPLDVRIITKRDVEQEFPDLRILYDSEIDPVFSVTDDIKSLYYWHEYVLNGTKLKLLKQTSYDEITRTDGCNIWWYIPEKLAPYYQADCQRQANEKEGTLKSEKAWGK